MSLYSTRREPARQPKPVATGFEGKRDPRDGAAGPDRLIPLAMQQSKQPFWARLQLLARLTLNAGKHTANQPARVADLDHGNEVSQKMAPNQQVKVPIPGASEQGIFCARAGNSIGRAGKFSG